jgi:hypothetical protein
VATVRKRAGGATPLAAESGCLVIADISGYTGYVVESPLSYAEDVVSDLADVVAGRLGLLFRVNKREGDAVFAYALADEMDGATVLDALDDCYEAFHRRLEGIGHATSCSCAACAKLPELDLKLVVHAGEFIRRPAGAGEELTGHDVILVHRLLKNGVAAAFATTGYALLTEACARQLRLDPDALGLPEHRERYEHVGEVRAFVLDLGARRRESLERRRVVVSPEEASFAVEAILPAEPPVAWELLTAPERRAVWSGIAVHEETGGRRGAGTTAHCVDGRREIYEEILDWRPFEYFTEARTLPGGGGVVLTTSLEPVPGGTKVATRGRRDAGRLAWLRDGRRLVRRLEEGYRRLPALVAAERPD